MSEKRSLIIPVRMSRQAFREFAYFNTFRLHKRWQSPLIFSALMLGFALLVAVLGRQTQGAWLLAAVLCLVGLLLPAVYFLSFQAMVRRSASTFPDEGQPAYRLSLEEEGLRVLSYEDLRRELAFFPWTEIHAAYRRSEAYYLYATANQAYLLPFEATPGGAQSLDQWLSQHMADRIK